MSPTLTLGIAILSLAADGGVVKARVDDTSPPPAIVRVHTAIPLQAETVEMVPEVISDGEELGQPCDDSCGTCGTCEPCGDGCTGHLPCTWYCWWFSCCDMPQHMPYYPAEHGYYYFRPYHHSHVLKQSSAVASWGGDPRNPYSNEIFDRVYAELRAEEQGDDSQQELTTPPEPPADTDQQDVTQASHQAQSATPATPKHKSALGRFIR